MNARNIIVLTVLLLCMASDVQAQDYDLSYGAHDFQVNSKKWTKIKFPETQYYFDPTPSQTIRMKYDDGQEFQVLPEPKDFKQGNGTVIKTKYLKATNGKRLPVDNAGWMPTAFLYLKAENGTANVHMSITRPSTPSPTSQIQQRSATPDIPVGTILILGVIGFLSFVVAMGGIEKKCPSCTKWWARRVKESNEVDRNSFYDTVTRCDEHFNADGDQAGYTHRQEQVRYTKVMYEDINECKYCQHQWTTSRSNVFEGGHA